MGVRLCARQCVKHSVCNLIISAQTRNNQKNIFGFNLRRSKQAQKSLRILPDNTPSKREDRESGALISVCAHFTESHIYRYWCLSEPNPRSTAIHWREDQEGQEEDKCWPESISQKVRWGPRYTVGASLPALLPLPEEQIYYGKNGQMKSLNGPPTAKIIPQNSVLPGHCRNQFHKDLKDSGLMIFYHVCICFPHVVGVKGCCWRGMQASEHNRLVRMDSLTCPQHFCQHRHPQIYKCSFNYNGVPQIIWPRDAVL